MNPTNLMAALPSMDQERLRNYRDYLDFYNGLQWPDSSFNRRERRLTFNYAKVAVDKVASYVMAGFSFGVEAVEGGPQAAARAGGAERALVEVYETNNLSALDFDTEVDTAILGDGCFKVCWDERERRVRISSPDPQGLYAWWLADDTSRVWRVASKYSLSDEEAEMLFRKRPAGRQAAIVELWTADRFAVYMDQALVEEGPNPYGFIPFVVFPNLREPKKFWGLSDIPTLMEPQRELNRALSQLSRILELSGNPIAVLENVESSQDIAVQPGAVWNVPEDAKAYLLDLLQGGGVRLHIDYIDLLYRALHDTAESPRAAFGGVERDLSGVALEIELHPLLQKVRRKRTLRTAAYKQRNMMALALLRKFEGRDFGPVLHHVIWGPVLPQDKQRQSQYEQVLVNTGLHSRRTAMEEVGIRDPEKEFRQWLAERRSILEQEAELGNPVAAPFTGA
ncbi:MAG: phage portal protein [Chloroflexi bacterium]|nr:phage portal protein [Chloroflexota bacterium]